MHCVPAYTSSPAPFATGTLSPVIAAWSTDEPPATTTPSSGMISPGLTITVSPTPTSSTPTVTSAPSRLTLAVCGARWRSEAIERSALPAAYSSRNSAMA